MLIKVKSGLEINKDLTRKLISFVGGDEHGNIFNLIYWDYGKVISINGTIQGKLMGFVNKIFFFFFYFFLLFTHL